MYSINDEVERKRRKDNFFFYHWIEKEEEEEEEVNVYDVYLLKERERERVDKKMLRVNE
jgi:hypothetical protein